MPGPVLTVTTQLSCGCTVELKRAGDLVTQCPNGHRTDTPDHRRPWC